MPEETAWENSSDKTIKLIILICYAVLFWNNFKMYIYDLQQKSVKVWTENQMNTQIN